MDAERVLSHQRVGLLVGTFETDPDLDRAELVFEGTDCVYRTPDGATFPNNSTLDLVRGSGCVPLEGRPTGRIHLTVVLRNQARLALWTHIAPTSSVTSKTLHVDSFPEVAGEETLVVSGRLVNEAPSSGSAAHRRIHLLSYVWQVAPSSWWIWLAMIAGTTAVAIGFMGLWNPLRVTTAAEAGRRGGSALLLTAGLGLLYAVLTPPFQAPDEPHHFVDFTEVTARPELVAQADAWAALAHVVRLRFRADQQFRPADIGKPERAWERQYAPDSSVRGGGVHVMWKGVAPLVRAMPAPRVLLSLRLVNALWLALVIGCVVALFIRRADVASPHLLAFPILLVPTLPFYGMHVSNHAPLAGAYVMVAAGLALVVMSRNSGYVSGLLVGSGWALAIALSRSALPLAPLIAAVCSARLLFGPTRGGVLSAGAFWAGVIMPVVLVLWMSDAAYVATNTSLGGSGLPGGLQAALEALTRWPWLMTLVIPLLAVLEWGLARLRIRTGPRLRIGAGAVTRWSAGAAAGLLCVMMIGSVFLPYPGLARIDPVNRPSGIDYALDALLAGLTLPRMWGPDYMTSVTFWGGFGWLETIASDWFVSVLSAATGFALVGLLIVIARTSDTRRGFFLAAAVAGFSTGLVTYALSLSQVEVAVDLVGRYLLGLYLSMVLICWSGIGLIPNGPSRQRLQSAVSIACVLACTGIHVYCLRLLLYRYF